jgi:hypothetical protein
MIRHHGFNLGNYATWDPRCDTLLIYYPEIEKAKESINVPFFDLLTFHHELNHRYFYKSPVVVDIVGYSDHLEYAFLEKEELRNLCKNGTEAFRNDIKKFFKLIQNVGKIMDATHAFTLLVDYKITNENDYEVLLKYLATVLDKDSKSIFDEIVWFSKNIANWPYVISHLIDYSMFLGSSINKIKYEDMYHPGFILIHLLITIKILKIKGSNELDDILSKIVSPSNDWTQYIDNIKSITGRLSKTNHLLELFTPIEFDMKTLTKDLTKSTTFRMLGRKFLSTSKNELQKQMPSVVLVQHLDNQYEYVKRKYMRADKYIIFLMHLALVHFQDCVLEGAELECYLCQLGFCNRLHKSNPKLINDIHRVIETDNKIIYH